MLSKKKKKSLIKIAVHPNIISIFSAIIPVIILSSIKKQGPINPYLALYIALLGNGLNIIFIINRNKGWNLPLLLINAHLFSLFISALTLIPITIFPLWNTHHGLLIFKLSSLFLGLFAMAFSQRQTVIIEFHDIFWILPSLILFALLSINGSYHNSGDCWVHIATAKKLLEGTFIYGQDPMINSNAPDIRYSWSLGPPLLATLSHITLISPLEMWIYLSPVLALFAPPASFLLGRALGDSSFISAFSSLGVSLLLLNTGSWAVEGSLLALPSGWCNYILVPCVLAISTWASRGKIGFTNVAIGIFIITTMHLFYGLILAGIAVFSSINSMVLSSIRKKKSLSFFQSAHSLFETAKSSSNTALFSPKAPLISSSSAFFTVLIIISVMGPLIALRLDGLEANNPFFLYFPENTVHSSYDLLYDLGNTQTIDISHSFLSMGMSTKKYLPGLTLILSLIFLKFLRVFPGFPYISVAILLPMIMMHIPFICEFIIHNITLMKVQRLYQFMPVLPLSGMLIMVIYRKLGEISLPNGDKLAKMALFGLALSALLLVSPSPERLGLLKKRDSLSDFLDEAAFLEIKESLSYQPPGTVLASEELSLLIPGLTHHKAYSLPLPHYSPSISDAISRNMVYPFVMNLKNGSRLKKFLGSRGINMILLPKNHKEHHIGEEFKSVYRGDHFDLYIPRNIVESGIRV